MPVVTMGSPSPPVVGDNNPLDIVVQQQLSSLDDTDTYASAWADLVVQNQQQQQQQQGGACPPPCNHVQLQWGGRGRGGRGLARRTYQPKDIVVENVDLEYVGIQDQVPGKALLENATLKLLAGHVYALVGRNGVGKSTLLRRIQAGKIPGFPPHVSTLYIPQELPLPLSNTKDKVESALELVQDQFVAFSKRTKTNLQYQMEILEKQLEQLGEDDEAKMEALCEEMSDLQEAIDETNNNCEESTTTTSTSLMEQAKAALAYFGLDQDDDLISNQPYNKLSPGQRKKVALAVAVLCCSSAMISSQQQQFLLLCLDEPTNHLDVAGLVQLRRFLQQQLQHQTEHNSSNPTTTVLLVSHDTDLLNDVATDIISFSHIAKTLLYYPGNYWDYQRQYAQQELHLLKQQVALDKKRQHMIQTIQHIKDSPAPRRGGNRKKSKQIAAQRKKLARQGLQKTDDKGHRWTQQKYQTGIQKGSINSIDATKRKDLSTTELLKLAESAIKPPPDKAIQFVFRNTNCKWGEPLIMAMDVGHGYGPFSSSDDDNNNNNNNNNGDDPTTLNIIRKKPGYLFDCVDLCIKEGHKYCLLGESACGKTTLLRLLAKQQEEQPPLEGSIHHAHNVQIGYFGQETMDQLFKGVVSARTEGGGVSTTTALSYLSKRYPNKTEQEIRGELTNFGLNPVQAKTNIRFLSGGERCRLCLAALMLQNPHVLCLDNPTTNLDTESVEALIHGLQQWKDGTVVLVSHDANLIRSLDAECAVLIPKEGKLRRIDGSIDQYLKTFKY